MKLFSGLMCPRVGCRQCYLLREKAQYDDHVRNCLPLQCSAVTGRNCKFRTTTCEYLLRHIERCHGPQQPFQCGFCKTPMKKESFKKHIKLRRCDKLKQKCPTCPRRVSLDHRCPATKSRKVTTRRRSFSLTTQKDIRKEYKAEVQSGLMTEAEFVEKSRVPPKDIYSYLKKSFPDRIVPQQRLSVFDNIFSPQNS